jgi:hypothetical protein
MHSLKLKGDEAFNNWEVADSLADARNTAEELRTGFTVAKYLGVEKLYLVSDYWHLLRIRLMLYLWKNRGIQLPCEIQTVPAESATPSWKRMASEIVKMLYTLWDPEWTNPRAEKRRTVREDLFRLHRP